MLLFSSLLGQQFLIFAGFRVPAAHCGSYSNSPAAADLRVSPWQSVPPMNETCSDHLHVAYCHFFSWQTQWFCHGKWISPQHFLISYDSLERKLRLFSVCWIEDNKNTSIWIPLIYYTFYRLESWKWLAALLTIKTINYSPSNRKT